MHNRIERISVWVGRGGPGRILGWFAGKWLVGFNSLVVLATIGIFAELFAGSLSNFWKILILFLTVLISAHVFFVQTYMPGFINDERVRKTFINLLLERVTEEFAQGTGEGESLRINVMRKKTRLGYPRHLQIVYYRGNYADSELEQHYKIGIGCCGWAFQQREQIIYDKVTNTAALREMTATQQDTTEHVHAILSTPIFREELDVGEERDFQPIGILNLDSTRPMSEVGLDTKGVQDLAARYATLIGKLL